MKKRILKYTHAKKIFCLLILLLVLIAVMPTCISVFSQTDEDEYSTLYEDTYTVLDNYDYSEVDKLIHDIDSNLSFKEIILGILNGNLNIEADNILSYIFQILGIKLKSIMPICVAIILIAVAIKIISSFSPNIFKDGISNIINLVATCIIIILIAKLVIDINSQVYNTINTMLVVINALFPIIITLMGVIGANASVSMYSPITAILNTAVANIILKWLYPIYIISFVLILISGITNKIKLSKFIDFLSSLFKSIISLVFVIFGGVFAINGISSGKYDTISVYTTKFAIKNYIPLIGSYISDGFNYLVLSSILVKNAIGLAGIVIIFVMLLSPLIHIMLVKLALSFVASITDMFDNTTSNIMTQVSKILAFPIAMIAGVAFMFVMTLALAVMSANII